MLRSTMMISLALGFAAPAMADSAAVSTGTYEGQEFQYSSRLEADTVLIEGKFVKDGEPFRFAVRPNGAVSGEVGRTPVSFRVSRAERDSVANSLKRAQEPLVASR